MTEAFDLVPAHCPKCGQVFGDSKDEYEVQGEFMCRGCYEDFLEWLDFQCELWEGK